MHNLEEISYMGLHDNDLLLTNILISQMIYWFNERVHRYDGRLHYRCIGDVGTVITFTSRRIKIDKATHFQL